MKQWKINGVTVALEMRHEDDSDLGLALKTENTPFSPTSESVTGGADGIGAFGVSLTEPSMAERVIYWPAVSIEDADRRYIINRAAREALEEAERDNLKSIGFFTTGLEISRVPSWEVADALVKAVVNHLKESNGLETIWIVASSPMQLSSFEFALKNHWSHPVKLD